MVRFVGFFFCCPSSQLSSQATCWLFTIFVCALVFFALYEKLFAYRTQCCHLKFFAISALALNGEFFAHVTTYSWKNIFMPLKSKFLCVGKRIKHIHTYIQTHMCFLCVFIDSVFFFFPLAPFTVALSHLYIYLSKRIIIPESRSGCSTHREKKQHNKK